MKSAGREAVGGCHMRVKLIHRMKRVKTPSRMVEGSQSLSV